MNLINPRLRYLNHKYEQLRQLSYCKALQKPIPRRDAYDSKNLIRLADFHLTLFQVEKSAICAKLI